MKYVRICIFCAFLLLSLYAAYISRKDIARLFNSKPCASVINYSIGEFDTRFGISSEDFLDELLKAEKVWEDAAGKQLFNYTTNPDSDTLSVNLIYDYRQEATDILSETGGTIEESKETYDKAKAEYEQLVANYETRKRELDEQISSYEKDKKAYDDQVDYWNDKGGAPSEEYRQLQKDRDNLNNEADDINAEQKSLNTLAKKINTSASELNTLGKRINLHVEDYNQTVNSAGEEFNEGEYRSDDKGERINVYQFDNKNVLQRLLIHELGHAIGLDHVDDENAIMYRLNQSSNRNLSNDDLEELKNVCGV